MIISVKQCQGLENCYLCDLPRKLQIYRSSREYNSFLLCIRRRALCSFLSRVLVTNVPRLAVYFCESRMRRGDAVAKIKRDNNVVPTMRRGHSYYAKGRRISQGRQFLDVCPTIPAGVAHRKKPHTHTHARTYARTTGSIRFPWHGSRCAQNTCQPGEPRAVTRIFMENSVSLIRSLHRRHAIDKSTCSRVCYRL